MKHCIMCGKQHEDSSRFCKYCGTQFSEDLENTNLPKNHVSTLGKAVSTRKKTIIISVIALFLCVVLLFVSLIGLLSVIAVYSSLDFGGLFSSKGLNVEFSETGISDFSKKICKKVDGEAILLDPNYDSPASMYGNCYETEIEVKRYQRVSETVHLRFYNTGSYDNVSKVSMILSSFERGSFSAPDYENIFECEKAVLVALEKTVAGNSYVDNYLTTYQDMCFELYLCESGETKELASYSLTDDLTVTIEIENDGAWGNKVYYTLTKDSFYP